MDEKPDPDIQRLKDLAAMIGVHFKDFLLVVRTQDGMAWKYSDPTWGIGAAIRYHGVVESGTMHQGEEPE